MHAVESISDETSIKQDAPYIGTSESRPHSACNVETRDPKSATAQIGEWGKGCTDHFGVRNSEFFAEGRTGKTASPPTNEESE